MEKIAQINSVIDNYFIKNPNVNIISCKELMPNFVNAGIFETDQKKGLPIRSLLRKLDGSNQLYLIPSLVVKRKLSNTNWFFAKSGHSAITRSNDIFEKPSKKTKVYRKRTDSDEFYIIDLCDKILKINGLRQHHFDFLLGDTGKSGRKVKLPVDVYYQELNLVIEFKEQQHTKSINHFDKPHLLTISGVHRGEQRHIYDLRRTNELSKQGISLLEISYDLFKHSSSTKLLRNYNEDLKILDNLLHQFKNNK